MNILTRKTLILGFILFSSRLWAIGLDEVNVLEMSSSGKSIVLDRGLLENYSDGSYAKFFLQTGDFHDPKIFLIADGKLIKSFPKKSFWYMDNVFLPKLVKAGNKILVLTTNHINTGRPIVQKQKHVVVSENQYDTVEDYLAENQNNVPNRLIQEIEDYEKSDELFETKKVAEADQIVQSYEKLRKRSGEKFLDQINDPIEERYFIGNREVHLGDIKNAEDKKLLDSIAQGYIKKTNSQKYGLEKDLYKNQKMAPGTHDLSDRLTVSSVYEQSKEDQKAKFDISKEAVAKIDRDGPHWSEDMDDKALRRYFIRTGLEHEARRRELALNELDGNEILFHYSGSMSDHTSSNYENYRNLGYSLGLAYDLHLSRTSKNIRDWSLEFILEVGVSDYDIGGQNARGAEGSYGAYANYYFMNNPLTLNSLILLGGIGIKAGSIKMANSTLSREYSYQALTLPAFQFMGKYRFRTGDLNEDTVNVGASMNFGVMLDMKRLSVIESLSDNINGKISVNDLKYMVGMGFYF